MSISIRIVEAPRLEDAPQPGQTDLCWRFALTELDAFQFSVQTVVSGPADRLLCGTVSLYAPQARVAIAEGGHPRLVLDGRTLQETKSLDPDHFPGLRALRDAVRGRTWSRAAIDAFPQEWADAALLPVPASARGGMATAQRVLTAIAIASPASADPLQISIGPDGTLKVSADGVAARSGADTIRELTGLVHRATAMMAVTPGRVASFATGIPLVAAETLVFRTAPPSAHMRMGAIAALDRWVAEDTPDREERHALRRAVQIHAGRHP